MTASEARLWTMIRAGKAGGRFRRQVAIGFYIVDFACFRPKLAVEIDDTSHRFRDETSRTASIESRGFTLLRFSNEDVAFNADWVFETIKEWISLNREVDSLAED
jgi:very-short-patch-repair endonuclease